ncbi:MAG: LacI family DNA-binding transcriptional regulator [bacterium]
MTTIRDVAEQARVSIATVSRVFNGSARVSAESRRRVEQAAGKLGYWPNHAARSLSTRATDVIGVLLPELHGDFFSDVIHGIDQAARERGRQVLLSSTHAKAEDVLRAARSMRGRIDGLIVMAPDVAGDTVLREIVRRIPTVLVNPRSIIKGCHVIIVSNREGAASVTRHLIERTGGPVAIVTGPPGNADANMRLSGFRDALSSRGFDPDDALELEGDFTEESGYRAGKTLADANHRPPAVFCANDSMAVGLLGAFREKGIRVPEDMAVGGFDDIAISRYLDPSLTTAHVDSRELGAHAVPLLLEEARPGPRSYGRRITVNSRLIVRRSSETPSRDPERRGGPGKRTSKQQEVSE